jgi:hypothetical protein
VLIYEQWHLNSVFNRNLCDFMGYLWTFKVSSKSGIRLSQFVIDVLIRLLQTEMLVFAVFSEHNKCMRHWFWTLFYKMSECSSPSKTPEDEGSKSWEDWQVSVYVLYSWSTSPSCMSALVHCIYRILLHGCLLLYSVYRYAQIQRQFLMNLNFSSLNIRFNRKIFRCIS